MLDNVKEIYSFDEDFDQIEEITRLPKLAMLQAYIKFWHGD